MEVPAATSSRSRVLELLTGVQNHEREFPDIEYEVKFSLRQGRGLDAGIQLMDRALQASDMYLSDNSRQRSEMQTHFFTDGSAELSIFRWRGAPMLKCKHHRTMPYAGFTIFRNSEVFRVDPEEIREALASSEVCYVGAMIKRRIKDFVLDTTDGRFYSAAVTHCSVGSEDQYQLELEYAGVVAAVGRRSSSNEAEILEGLSRLAKYVQERSEGELVPDSERKFAFVNRRLKGAALQAVGLGA